MKIFKDSNTLYLMLQLSIALLVSLLVEFK